mgnify:FL=1
MSIKDRLRALTEFFSSKVASIVKPAALDEAFNMCKEAFGFIPAAYTIVEQGITAYVSRLGIKIDRQWIDKGGMKMFVELSIHELGHPYWCPGGIANHIKFAKLANKKLGTNLDDSLDFVSEMLNTIYDIIVDTMNQQKKRADIQYQTTILYDGFEETRCEDLNKDKASALLLAYPESIVGTKFTGCSFSEDVATAAEQMVEIAKSDISMFMKVDKMLDICIPFFLDRKKEDEQDGDGDGDGQGQGQGGKGKGKGKGKGNKQAPPSPEQLAQLAQQIRDARKEAGKGNSPVSEAASGDNPEDAIMAAIDSNDPDAVKIAGGYCGYTPELMEKALLRKKAINLLSQFMLKGTKPGAPNSMRVGSKDWQASSRVDDLDVIRSLSMSATTLIPGVNTLQAVKHTFAGTEKAGVVKRVWASVDVSGSMDKDGTILFIYALGLWAGKHGIEIGVNLWSNFEKLYPSTYKTGELLDKLWAEYGNTGGGTSVSGLRNLRGQLKKGDILFYVTDFCTMPEGKEEARQLLSEFKSQGVKVVFLAMFDFHQAQESGHEFFDCRTIEELPKVSLQIMNK